MVSLWVVLLYVINLQVAKVTSLQMSPHNKFTHSKITSYRPSELAPNDILVDANYNLAAGALVVGTICGILENFKGFTARFFGAGAVIFTLFGGFITYQTANLRFKFNEDSFSLVKSDGTSIGDNVVVGGENSWKYTSFVNYAFLPSEKLPILVYFKEVQTPEELWVETPIIVDKLKGQQHFFPCIASAEQLKQNFERNGCKRDSSSNGIESINLQNNIIL